MNLTFLATDFSYNVFQNFNSAINLGYVNAEILGILITLVFTIMITRDSNEIKVALLPVAMLVSLMGFQISIPIMMLLGMISTVTMYVQTPTLQLGG